MDKGNVSAGSQYREIARFDGGEETRRVWVRDCEEGAIEVGELTRGPLTREVYGEDEHDHRVRMGRHDLRTLAAGTPGAADPMDAVAALLSDEDVFLCDLMDMLDARELPYTYLSISRHGIIFRPTVSVV